MVEFSSGLDGPFLADTLRGLYPRYPLVRFGDHFHPITVLPASYGERDNIEASLGELTGDDPIDENYYADEWDPQGRELLSQEVLRAAAIGGWNGSTYAFQCIRRDVDRVRIDAFPGRYFQNMATADSLDLELSEVLERYPRMAIPLSHLPRRRWITERVADPVVDGSRRCAALSISCAVVARRPAGGFGVILGPRSSKVRRHAHFNHVAPSGVLQPPRRQDQQWGSWFSIWRNLLKEYAEELYSIEPGVLSAEIAAGLDGVPEISRLLGLIARGGAEIRYTGVSVNLLMLRPEICTTLIVNDEEWLDREYANTAATDRQFSLGEEYLTERDSHELPAHRRRLSLLRLDDHLQPVGDDSELRPSALVPQAAAAIHLAVRSIKQH